MRAGKTRERSGKSVTSQIDRQQPKFSQFAQPFHCCMLRPLIGIFLIMVLSAPFIVTFTCLKVQQKLVRKAVKRSLIAGLDKEELVLLSFTKAQTETELRWEHSKEFEYRGQMYDIVETCTEGDSIHYRCWWDHAETALCKKLDALATVAWGHHPKQKQHTTHLLSFLKTLYHGPYSPWSITVNMASTAPAMMEWTIPATVMASPPAPPPEPQGDNIAA
jgi:hypothetical protein